MLFASALTAAALCGMSCDVNLVEGTVETQQGERLPGVVVKVDGTRFQAMTNAQGVYKVRYEGPPVVMRYSKTGYAPGVLETDIAVGGRVETGPVQLWRLPASHGVWLYNDFNYVRARPVEPDRVTFADGTVTYGVKRPSDVETEAEIPFIVIFGRLPTYNISLSKLMMQEAPIEGLEGQTEIVWIPVRDIPVSPRALDKPDERLVHVRLFEPLEPGPYAVHWGALKEASPIDARAYLFSVLGDMPEPAPTAAGEEPAESEVESADVPPNTSAEDNA